MKTFVILGMHRSATSLVAKGLANEIDMGSKFEPAPDNPKGHWENWDFVNLNDRILAAAGGSWDNPPSRMHILGVEQQFSEEIKTLVGSFNAKGEDWGFKDPRTSLTVELYSKYLVNPHFIAIFRNPEDIAMSLQKRNGFSLEKGYLLAHEYNDRIIQFLCSRS